MIFRFLPEAPSARRLFRRSLLKISLLLTPFLTHASVSNPVHASEIYATYLKQDHALFGTTQTYFTDTCLKIEDSSGLGFVLIAKAPDWKVVVFRNDTQTIFSEDFAKFSSTGVVSESQLSRKGSVKFDRTNSRFEDFMGFQTIRTQNPKFFQFVPLPNGCPVQIAWIYYATLRTFYVPGIPITEVDMESNRSAQNVFPRLNTSPVYLSTRGLKRVPVAANFFDVPLNYTPVKTMPEVVFGR